MRVVIKKTQSKCDQANVNTENVIKKCRFCRITGDRADGMDAVARRVSDMLWCKSLYF